MSKIYHTQTLTIFKYLSLKLKYIVMNVFIEAIKIYKSIGMWDNKPVITEIIAYYKSYSSQAVIKESYKYEIIHTIPLPLWRSVRVLWTVDYFWQ